MFSNEEICNRISHLGCFECSTNICTNNRIFSADVCLWKEIKWLNENGVITDGCCCGHHINSKVDSAYIGVNGSEEKAKELGYEVFTNEHGSKYIIPKTKIKELK